MKDTMPDAQTAPPPLTPAGTFSLKFKKHLCIKHGFKCQYCAGPVGTVSAAHLDHIIARSVGGGDGAENLRLSCRTCNSIKRDHSVEHLRWCLRIRASIMGGIILPKQARALVDVGVALPLGEEYVLEFERGAAA